MSKTFRPYSPGQAFLLPPSPLEWLPEDHLARFVMDVVGKLDLGAIYGRVEVPEGAVDEAPIVELVRIGR